MKPKKLTKQSTSSGKSSIPLSQKQIVDHYCAFFNFEAEDLSPHQKRVIEWASQLTMSYQKEIGQLRSSHEKLEMVVMALHNDRGPSE